MSRKLAPVTVEAVAVGHAGGPVKMSTCSKCNEEITHDGRCGESCPSMMLGDVGFSEDVLEVITPALRRYNYWRKTLDADGANARTVNELRVSALVLSDAIWKLSDIRRTT
jgi:hypothetical protein